MSTTCKINIGAPSIAPSFVATSVPGFIGDGSGITGLSGKHFILDNANYPVITNDNKELTTEKYLDVTRGGTGIDSSELSGIAKITEGQWSASKIVDSDISKNASISDTKLATITTPGKVLNSATTATSNSTPLSIVSRDVNGDFTSRNITVTKLIQSPNANAQSSINSAYVSTADSNTTTLFTLSTASNGVHGTTYLVVADIVLGDVSGGINSGFYKFQFRVKNTGGNVTVSPILHNITDLDDNLSLTNISINTSSNNVLVDVTGLPARDIYWAGTFVITQVNF
ncbi:hypothetical protein QJ857_gp0498 [Tupanvirus soda lake]|uniref:Uncharacterized protein n=2 Tax=Tupanvirus TaxID=2094720 RepID=A0A6N1NWC4_9VIRU|nr:hypothetical protein QJ857_gp0498 [Tupanvirus soda lake]QKU35543.1 hypothetical protein [Tupanvirus soda lake]